MAQSKQLTRLEPWHHDLIDWWIANPRATGKEAAVQFGVSAVWISLVKHSPIFQAEFKRRRERLSRGGRGPDPLAGDGCRTSWT